MSARAEGWQVRDRLHSLQRSVDTPLYLPDEVGSQFTLDAHLNTALKRTDLITQGLASLERDIERYYQSSMELEGWEDWCEQIGRQVRELRAAVLKWKAEMEGKLAGSQQQAAT